MSLAALLNNYSVNEIWINSVFIKRKKKKKFGNSLNFSMIFQYILYSADLSYPDFIDVILCEYVCEHMYACTIHISAYIRYALINVFPLKKS